MNKWNRMIIVGLLASLGAACTSTSEQQTDGPGAQQDAETDTRIGAQDQGAIQSDPFTDPSSPLSTTTIYFDFDSSEIKAGDREVILAHARYLADNPDVKVVLEGHADERGTREYNIALGERRAKSVSQLMLLQGVAQSQLDIISFGEERPVALGHDESAWSLNRRVEILYPGR
ncbi:MAG: peptidoglycan-associated lipoprotein Pal [Thioalkalispiraceae bacterium]|jgi:peptidoglycan-associated lipoprotein